MGKFFFFRDLQSQKEGLKDGEVFSDWTRARNSAQTFTITRQLQAGMWAGHACSRRTVLFGGP